MKNNQYVDNSSFIEFCSEIADQMTRLKFQEQTYIIDVEGETSYTAPAQDYFNEEYDEIERLVNSILQVFSETDQNN